MTESKNIYCMNKKYFSCHYTNNTMKRDIMTVIDNLQDETQDYCDQINSVEQEIETVIYSRDKKAMKYLYQLYDKSAILKNKWMAKHTECFLLKNFHEGLN